MKQVLLILGSSIQLFACGGRQSSGTATGSAVDKNIVILTAAQSKNAAVATGKMEQKDVSSILKVNGVIDVPPENMVSVSAPLGGYLKSTELLPGMRVRKGQVIGILEGQQYIQLQEDYLTARAKIGFLVNEYQRQKELNSAQASSDKVYQQAEADYKSQQVLVTALAEKLKLAGIDIAKISETNISRSVNIYSPIDGFVSKVNINIGKYVSLTDVLFDLINPDDLHLALKVFEKDIDKLFVGQELIAYTNNQSEKKYRCKVALIGKDISMDRSTDVHCHFQGDDRDLVPGTYMNAEIEVKNRKALVLPSEAVVRFQGKQFVYRVKGKNEFERVGVDVGESRNGFTAIILPENDVMGQAEFVTRGAYSLLMMQENKDE